MENTLAKKGVEPHDPSGQRAIKIVPYLNRVIPYWGHPGYLAGYRWRSLVRNQPIAIVCRETLISNTLAMDWSVRLREPEETKLSKHKDEIDHYTEVFGEAEGDFDNYVSLIAQDILDLPFGAMAELGYENDDPEKRLLWIEHVDAATLMPTGDPNWPVLQSVPDVPSRPIVFPKHAIARAYLSPRPDIKRKGWGMAPPEKIYLAIEMLYRGDRYYANLLLDTPEAGILDLMDMSEESATEWIESARSLFHGIDGFKVPVLYEHDTPAQWIPLNRPPLDMMYDETTMKYAAILAAGYGLRLSDIGMSEMTGEGTLAGVIRGERQSRRTGRAVLRSKLDNHFDYMLPKHLTFIFEDKDEEAKTEQARALSTYGLAIGQLKSAGILSPEEARFELVATGLLEVEIDPEELPEPPPQPMMPGMPGQPGQQEGGKKPFGKPSDEDKGKVKKEKVAAPEGGRGGFVGRAIGALTRKDKVPDLPPDRDLAKELMEIVEPALKSITNRAAQSGIREVAYGGPDKPTPKAPRIRRLIKLTTRIMVPQVQKTFEALDDESIKRFWLPEMQGMDFGNPSELDSLITRQSQEEIRKVLDDQLGQENWWQTMDALKKRDVLDIFIKAYEFGLHDTAVDIVRALYEEGLGAEPFLSPAISFDLVDREVIRVLEESAATMVTRVNEGTKTFIRRVVTAGVRQGLSRPRIAQAIREGEYADRLLRDEGYMEDVINETLSGLFDIPEWRAESIANTEVNRAQNAGHMEQIIRSALTKKAWTHLGARGFTAKGYDHPCPVCLSNEEMGFVKADFLYQTVFKRGGPENDGRQLTPPGHPQICHCRVTFDEAELKSVVAKGDYAPWLGK